MGAARSDQDMPRPGADERTLRAYDENADALVARYESPAVRELLAKYLRVSFPRGSRILDLGAGTGRDLAWMASDGCQVYGVEPSEALRTAARRLHPDLAERIVAGYLPGGLPSFDAARDVPFDGILCSAVLQHVPSAYLFDAAYAIRLRLRDGGRLLVSIPRDRPDVGEGGRDIHGRLFNGVKPDELALLLERIGFRRLDRWDDEDVLGQPGLHWVTMLFVLHSSAVTRPLDQVESILSRDRKTATYKFALIRALAEIATTRPHLAEWRNDRVHIRGSIHDGASPSKVGVPVDAVAERWLLYYWPLIEAGPSFRQIHGAKPPRFQVSLQRLIDRFRHAGKREAFAAVSAFAEHRRRNQLERDPDLVRVMGDLRKTIIKGPVEYAHGGPDRAFEHIDGQIVMDAALWTELSLMGHWILDALVLRWAEMTSELNRGTQIAKVIELLRQPHDPKRDQDDGHRLYDALDDLECVWTGHRLSPPGFEIDHVLPYSLWRNNDLWNLLPASKAANGKKSDKLPTRELMASRRQAMHRYWQHAREQMPERFDREAVELIGTTTRDGALLSHLFQVVCECVEVTALQRGVERWPVWRSDEQGYDGQETKSRAHSAVRPSGFAGAAAEARGEARWQARSRQSGGARRWDAGRADRERRALRAREADAARVLGHALSRDRIQHVAPVSLRGEAVHPCIGEEAWKPPAVAGAAVPRCDARGREAGGAAADDDRAGRRQQEAVREGDSEGAESRHRAPRRRPRRSGRAQEPAAWRGREDREARGGARSRARRGCPSAAIAISRRGTRRQATRARQLPRRGDRRARSVHAFGAARSEGLRRPAVYPLEPGSVGNCCGFAIDLRSSGRSSESARAPVVHRDRAVAERLRRDELEPTRAG
ncbi:MAG: methyltransferase domain-containing protein, partial [Deltaproteobacteria bacterium]|nr:methyltransferase domain-containing protein [Deltaproteobacteria bacterium]